MTDFNTFFSSMNGKHVAVLGFGISNRPLIRLLQKSGAEITVCDKKEESAFSAVIPEFASAGIRFQLGEHYLDRLSYDYIFRSPGIRPDHPEIQKAVLRGSILTSEMEIFMEVCPCPVIAVTGSDGKTTTSTLISKILRESGKNCFLGGNIGKPLLSETENIAGDDVVVLELSSFQLMTMKKSPDIAVITNIAPNHLDWHTSMEEYIHAKENIYRSQKAEDTLIINADNEITASFAEKAKGNIILFSRKKSLPKGLCIENEKIVKDGFDPIVSTDEILLPGEHNLENYMAAAAAAIAFLGRDAYHAVGKVARSFQGVQHRIELIREKNGVRYYNDSIASSPTRTIAGLHSFPQKVLLIAGGYDKKIPFDDLGPEILEHVKNLYLIGQTAKKIRDAVEKCPEFLQSTIKICEYPSLKDAVSAANNDAEEGDIVILSPACASFDMFSNFEERGRSYQNIVNSL